uniref:VWFA domain-containing protein n=1 Tax=Erpetoichthys calabaricus TaxID=27687 RepID=A0A8C4TMX7_ERPCA
MWEAAKTAWRCDAGRRDIVFLLDGSENTRNSFPAIQEFVKTVAEKFDVGTKKAQISVVQYSDDPEAMFYVNSHPTQESVLRAIASLQHKGGRALNTGKALQFVKENVFITPSGSRHLEGVPQFLVVIAGGRSRDDIQDPIRALKQSGVVPFVVTRDANIFEMQTLSTEPSNAFTVSDFGDLPNIQQQLLIKVARQTAPDSSAVPGEILSANCVRCSEDGVQVKERDCTHLWVPFKGPLNPRAALCHKCDCVPVPWTESPQLLFSLKASAPAVTADIIFLVDSSWSIGKDNFQFVREFLYKVVKALKTGGGDFKFALVQYSGSPKTEFQLSTYSSVQDVLFHIWSMPYLGGGTRTGLGLEYLIEQHLTAAAGSRANEGVPQVVVVLTDGRSQDDVIPPSSVLQLADARRPVGVLKLTAGKPCGTARRSCTCLLTCHQRDSTCVSHLDTKRVPTKGNFWGPEIKGEATKRQTSDPMGRDGCQCLDIVFLFDGTNDARNALPAIREFIRRMSNSLEVEEDKVRIAVVQYSDDAKTHFNLNTHKTQKAVVNALRSMKPKGGKTLNTGAALQFVKDNVFNTSAGSRVQEGVPQLLIVLSGGKSADDVAAPSKALKRKGVKTLSIGMKNVDTSELLTVSSSPEFYFNLAEIGELLSISPQISFLIKTKLGSKDPTPEGKHVGMIPKADTQNVCSFADSGKIVALNTK